MKAINLLMALACAAWGGTAYAYGEMQSLPGSQIVMAGDIKKVTCPISGKYDCLSWPSNLYEFSMQNVCFTTTASCSLSCEGFIAQKGGTQTLYVLGGFSGLDSANIKLFKCPEKF